MGGVPDIRVRRANDAPVHPEAAFVLYWMISSRRPAWNFGLQRAAERARELGKPLIVLEALRAAYPWASERFHRFILDGMAVNARRLKKAGVLYHPYLEPSPGAGKGLLAALAEKACLVVTDDFPAFFLPGMVRSAARTLAVRLEQVDSNGLLPMAAADRVYPTAYAFRRFLQRALPSCLAEFPLPDPLKGAGLAGLSSLPKDVVDRWPPAPPGLLEGDPEALGKIPMDHRVPAGESPGGAEAAEGILKRFLERRLSFYPENRNHPDEDVTSGLSPYLHFGHLSVHQIFAEIAEKEEWSPEHLSTRATGGRSGWWGMGEAAEAFLDQLVTWRELGFNMCARREDYEGYESLPPWALKTLKDHRRDRRPYLYTLDQFEAARTHDRLWNAAQTQLIREGRIHNYLRMVWGKKILEWTRTPEEALETMIELNNKYALDGRDPNSYSGIMWILGRYDRAFGPERSVFGKVRYMSSENTLRKLRMKDYLEKYGSP